MRRNVCVSARSVDCVLERFFTAKWDTRLLELPHISHVTTHNDSPRAAWLLRAQAYTLLRIWDSPPRAHKSNRRDAIPSNPKLMLMETV